MAMTIDELNIKIEAEFSNASNSIANLTKRFGTFSNAVTKNTNKASFSFNKFTDNMARSITKWRTLMGVAQQAANTMASWYKESNDYIETLNLFSVTMGDATESARAYAETVNKMVGIDVAEWMNFQGTFKQLTSGYGVANDAANTMSKNLTQLSYDLASFFNTDTETAFDKLSSAMSGQVKGLREFGIDTTIASLQTYALSKGIEQSVSTMTQAQKSLLRYNYIMEKSVQIQGDMARTLVTPANSLRVLSSLLTQLKRALGNIVSVIVTQFIPYVQALVSVVTDAANALAKLLGFELPKIDYSSLGNNGLGSVLEDAEESAGGVADKVKEIKKQLMGFDELNIISSPNKDAGSGGGSGSVGVGGDLGMDLYEYDFLKGLDTSKLDEIKEKMKDVLWYSGVIMIAIAGWKFGKLIGGLLGFTKTLGLSLGFAMSLSGAFIELKGFLDAWANGLDGKNIFEMLFGGALLTGGSAVIGKMFAGAAGAVIGAGFGAIFAGIPIFLASLKDALVNGLDNISATLIPVSTALMGAGIGALIGSVGGPLGALIGLIVGLFIDGLILVKENWGTISTFFKDKIIGPVSKWFGDLWNNIKKSFSQGIDNVNEKVNGWSAKFAQTINNIGAWFGGLWSNVKTFTSNTWQWIVTTFKNTPNWFNTSVIKPVGNFFVGMWNGLKKGASDAWSGIKSVFSSVGTFFGNIFSDAWRKVVNVFSSGGAIFTDIKNGILTGFKSVVNGLIRGINSVVSIPFSGINSALSFIRNIKFLGITPFKNLGYVSIPSIPMLASGGMVDTGQMFIAREAGPELVGQIGNKTAVANNNQIVSGIEAGVYRAMMSANGNGGKPININITTEMDGEVVSKKVIKYHNGVVMQTGESPFII